MNTVQNIRVPLLSLSIALMTLHSQTSPFCTRWYTPRSVGPSTTLEMPHEEEAPETKVDRYKVQITNKGSSSSLGLGED